MEQQHGIFSDLLSLLGVKHTVSYSEEQFAKMPFPTIFGLSKLLESYGIASVGLELGNKAQIDKLPVPFVAQTVDGYVLVKALSSDYATYLTQGIEQKVPITELIAAMTNKVLVVNACGCSGEPNYVEHRLIETADGAKKWILAICCVALFAYCFISNHIYDDVSKILLSIIGLAGIYITYLLVQKSAHIKNRRADAVCNVVQAGGCDDILNMSAAKFFGIFGWSEVGFAYFSVSLLCLLVFPQYTMYLAACNVLCLPFSFWSVWYQKFRAHKWCTLCLCVQGMLWLSFFCYLGGGHFKEIFPLRIEFFVLGISYISVMLGLNALMPLIDRKK